MPKAPRHIPTNGTTEVDTFKFCEKCGRLTLRLYFPEVGMTGPCMGCNPDYATKKQNALRVKREQEAQNPRLF